MSYQPKSYNKFLAGAATAAVVASAVVPVATHAAEKNLTDVKEGSYYAEAVNTLAEAGVIKGYEDGTFRPNNQVTRAEVAKIIAVQLGLDTENAGTANYSDANGHWANTGGYLAAVAKAGIMKGDGNGTFRPNAPLTRAEMASIVVRAYDLQAKEGFESQFKDLNAGGAWAADAIKTLEANGYANGIAKGQFGSASNVKRADVAVFLFRVAKGEAAPTVESVSAINNIEVNEGAETVNLPKEVEVKLSNGEKAQKAVEWDKKGLDLNKPGEYTLTGDVADTDLTASVKVVVKAVDPEVTSVSSINATQVEVKFNKAVDAKTLFVDGVKGAFKAGVISFTSLDSQDAGNLSGVLSEDGKTLTVTATKVLSKRYDVVVENVKTKDDKVVAKYSKMITIEADKTAPTILGTERISANKVKIKFSEPVQKYDGATLKYADGTTVKNTTISVAEGATEVVVDLSDSAVEVNKPITVTFIGLQDKAGNLVTPYPATVEIVKQQVDGVKPVVSSVNQTGAKTFNIKFSKDVVLTSTAGVINKSNVTVSNNTVSSIEKVTDSEYKVTVTKNLDGVQNVTVNAGYTDFSNQAGETTTKVVTFSVDTVAPKVTSAKVIVGSDNAEYLELTYDKDVKEGKLAISGSYVKDYVTSSLASTDVDATYASKDSKNVLLVKLASFATEKGANYKVDAVQATTGGVASLSGVAPEKVSTSFTRGEDGAQPNNNKLAAPTIAAATNDTLTVTFKGKVDGESATNVANYKVDGAVVESATLASYDDEADVQVVTLKLQENSNAFTGVRNITVENVRALGSSVTMDKFVKNDLSLTENVHPTVKKAELTANNEITLTFSEEVYDTTNTAGADFDLYIGGTKATATKLATETVAQDAAKNTIKLTISGTKLTADDLNKGLSLQAASTLDIKDTNNNALTVTNVSVAQQ
jgi:hypothetical protein